MSPKTENQTKSKSEPSRDYSPTPEEKRLLHNLSELERRWEEFFKREDCIVGLPLPKPHFPILNT